MVAQIFQNANIPLINSCLDKKIFYNLHMYVYIANICSVQKNPDLYASQLLSKHQSRALKIKSDKRKSQYIIGHLIARFCGKKHTSISYIDDFVVVAAASNARVGVAIENTTIEYDMAQIATELNFPTPKNKNEFFRQFSKINSGYKMGARPRFCHFIRYGDYIICITSTRNFAMPKLRKFDPHNIEIS